MTGLAVKYTTGCVGNNTVFDTLGRRWTMQIGDMVYYNVK